MMGHFSRNSQGATARRSRESLPEKHRTAPSCMVKYNRPRAAIRPSHAGSPSSLVSDSFFAVGRRDGPQQRAPVSFQCLTLRLERFRRSNRVGMRSLAGSHTEQVGRPAYEKNLVAEHHAPGQQVDLAFPQRGNVGLLRRPRQGLLVSPLPHRRQNRIGLRHREGTASSPAPRGCRRDRIDSSGRSRRSLSRSITISRPDGTALTGGEPARVNLRAFRCRTASGSGATRCRPGNPRR